MFQKPLNIDEMIFDVEIVLTAPKFYIFIHFYEYSEYSHVAKSRSFFLQRWRWGFL